MSAAQRGKDAGKEARRTSLIEWFGASTLHDDEGDPRVFYHGTASKEPFDVFAQDRQGQLAGVGGGFFFTNREDTAADCYGWRSGGVVLEVHLVAENPLTFDAYFELTGKDKSAETERGRMDPTNYFDEKWEEIIAFAKERGHDSIVWEDQTGDENACDLILVFEPWQVKSATHCDFYDRENPSFTNGAPAAALWPRQDKLRPKAGGG